VREVTLYTRAECHLCDDAADMLARLSKQLHFTVLKRDVDTDRDLGRRFNDVVPVVAVGDSVVAEAPVDEVALRLMSATPSAQSAAELVPYSGRRRWAKKARISSRAARVGWPSSSMR
jgi:thiol-disulfide isomerase/thioredoxin